MNGILTFEEFQRSRRGWGQPDGDASKFWEADHGEEPACVMSAIPFKVHVCCWAYNRPGRPVVGRKRKIDRSMLMGPKSARPLAPPATHRRREIVTQTPQVESM